jgi:hypothetical protein
MDVPPPPRRARFSLATLLLVMALAALGVTVWQLYAELVPMRVELRRLRDEVGELSIEDKTKLNAIAVRTKEPFTWKWRVWIPSGRKYQLHYADRDIPRQGFPRGHGMLFISEPGEMWIEYRISRDPNTGKWMDKLSTSNGSVGSSQQDWVEAPRRTSSVSGVGTTTAEMPPGEIALITRQKVSTKATMTNASQIEDPSSGFMIWLVPVK